MAYYLQMDGVDDQISVPSLTFNEVIIDFVSHRKATGAQYYFNGSFSNGFFYYTGSTDRYGTSWGSAYVDGVQVTNQTNFVPTETRTTLRALTTIVRTGTLTFFGIGMEYLKADVYSIKFYNGATLVAHYDMSTGTVQDQSGNGKHATLTGGTWVDDGAGGGTAHTKSLSDSVSTSESFSKRFSAMIIDSVTTGEGESERTTKAFSDTVESADSITYTQGKAVSLSDSIAISEAISKALTKWQTDGISTGDGDSNTTSKRLSDAIMQTDAITAFGGKSVILTEGITVSDFVAKSVGRLRSDGLGLAESLGKQLSVRLYDVVISTDEVNTYLPNAPEYRHVMRFPVRLNTRQTVNVTITQRKQFDVDI